MRTSRVEPGFVFAWLDAHCKVFRISRSAGNFSYSDELFDLLTREARVVSVAFGGGRNVWVMLWREGDGASPSKVVREHAHSRKELAFQELPTVSVDSRALLRLCLAAASGDPSSGASNVCGRLIVCVQDKHVEYYMGTDNPRVIHALEVGVTPRMELTLSVRTFTSCAARKFKRDLPRFELVDGTFLRRKLGAFDPDARELFCERAAGPNDRYGGFAFLDASNEDAFRRSKLGVLHTIMEIMAETFGDAVKITFEEARDLSVIRKSSTKADKRMKRVAERLAGREVCVSDATGTLGAEAEKVARIITESFGLGTTVSETPDHHALNIRLVLQDGIYGDEEHDPYDDDLGSMVVQHMTPSSGFDKTAVAVSVKELALKLDMMEGKVRLFEWGYGSWTFGTRCGEKGEELAFVSISEDGSLGFLGPMSALDAIDAHPELTIALQEDGRWECAVMGPEGDVCTIGRTDVYGLPNYELIARDITTPPEMRKLGRGGKPVAHAINRSGTDIELYFADAVDIASSVGADGTSYYRVGMRGPGMQYVATHKASILRTVVPFAGSRVLTEQLLPMLDTDLVRWGQPTVLPFPLKYLREWVSLRSKTSL